MQFDIITIFPSVFSFEEKPAPGGYFSASIIGRALKNKLIKINVHNLRDYTQDKRKTVDDTPYGGGAGMVMKTEPIYEAVKSIKAKIKNKKSIKSRIILFSAKGKPYKQEDALRLAKYDQLILICGRYEGVDERVAQYVADEEISIGNYVLTGGEIPAMIIVDSVSRLIPGVLGNPDSLKEESFNVVNHPSAENEDLKNIGEYPQYTKPEEFQNWKVPKILLSGNHQEIKKWREKKSKITLNCERGS